MGRAIPAHRARCTFGNAQLFGFSLCSLTLVSWNRFAGLPGFANRGLTHTTYGYEEDWLFVFRPLDAFFPVANAVCRGRTIAVD